MAPKQCGLPWSEEILATVYKSECRHHEPVAVTHEAEGVFEQFNPSPHFEVNSCKRLERDIEARENVLQSRVAELTRVAEVLTATVEQYRLRVMEESRKAEECSAKLAEQQQENAQYRLSDTENRQQIVELEKQIALVTRSRTWRWRQNLVQMPPLKWLSNKPATASGCQCQCSTRATRANSPVAGETAEVNLAERVCTIIIPVYNAFAEAQQCLRTVLEHTDARHNVLVIDDCSPTGRFADTLPAELKNDPRLCIERNEQNLGFVQTCNRGMRKAEPFDVVLLNSDTEVTARWLDKLQEAVYSHPTIGTATPLTNAGTICSVPEFLEESDLPAGYNLHDYATLIEAVSTREYPELPTCVGFCVYIKREVLDRTGLFDERSFGKGYGEENDLSCRLRKAGYIDILDDATFVYHHGRKSFQAKTIELTKKHLRVLERKHPDYLGRVNQFIAANPLQQIHRRIHDRMLYDWNDRARYSVLHILHNRPITSKTTNLPGGVEYHVADLIREIPEAAHWSLYPACGEFHLIAHVPGCEREYYSPIRMTDLPALLSPELFDVVHLHHVNGMDYRELTRALVKHGRYFVSLHDFRLCCPTINLLTLDDRLCNGHECTTSCRQRAETIHVLRSTTTKLFRNAEAVFHFSQSTREEYSKILGDDFPWQFIEHGISVAKADEASPDDVVQPSANVPVKVAFLGGIGVNKGANLIRKIIKTKRLPSGQRVEWHLIGLIDGDLERSVRQHGRYERKNLPAIMKKVSPHFTAILSIWPETYCYTFDEAIACGIPVISTPLGAPAERLKQHQCGWICDSLTPEGFLATLQRAVENWGEYCEVRRRVNDVPLNQSRRIAGRYHEFYREGLDIPDATATVRVTTIQQRFMEETNRRGRLWHRLAGRMLNVAMAALRMLKAQPLAIRLVRRLLSTSSQRKLIELSHLSARANS